MSHADPLVVEHYQLARRYFLQATIAGGLSLATSKLWSAEPSDDKSLAEAVKKLRYLTRQEDFATVERGNPLPYKLPDDKLREVGMIRETWQLEVVPDPESNSKVDAPLSKEKGTALTFEQLLKLGEKHAVRFLKVMTCNNGGRPLGMGLWEGVPLREVIWLAKPVSDIRRVFYHGYHNDDPKQLFQSSMPIGRVLEDPPGDHPVILCYKLNGELLTGKRGGPVRLVAPEAYGYKSVKWLQRVVLTNEPYANDTYANGNNDVDSWMKTCARFISNPTTAKPADPWPVTGLAQVGVNGLSKVQWWLKPKDVEWPADDPYYRNAPWKDAELLAPPTNWGGEVDGDLPADVRNFQEKSPRPKHWPQRYTIAHWAMLVPPQAAGVYELRCRTIDNNGNAQPMPRPFPKSGNNKIESVTVTVKEA